MSKEKPFDCRREKIAVQSAPLPLFSLSSAYFLGLPGWLAAPTGISFVLGRNAILLPTISAGWHGRAGYSTITIRADRTRIYSHSPPLYFLPFFVALLLLPPLVLFLYSRSLIAF